MKKMKKPVVLFLIMVVLFVFSGTSFAEDNTYWEYKKSSLLYQVRVSRVHYNQQATGGPSAPVDFTRVKHLNISITNTAGLNEFSNIHVYRQGDCLKWWDSKIALNRGSKCMSDLRRAVEEMLRDAHAFIDDVVKLLQPAALLALLLALLEAIFEFVKMIPII